MRESVDARVLGVLGRMALLGFLLMVPRAGALADVAPKIGYYIGQLEGEGQFLQLVISESSPDAQYWDQFGLEYTEGALVANWFIVTSDWGGRYPQSTSQYDIYLPVIGDSFSTTGFNGPCEADMDWYLCNCYRLGSYQWLRFEGTFISDDEIDFAVTLYDVDTDGEGNTVVNWSVTLSSIVRRQNYLYAHVSQDFGVWQDSGWYYYADLTVEPRSPYEDAPFYSAGYETDYWYAQNYHRGDTVEITVWPDEGWEFDHWEYEYDDPADLDHEDVETGTLSDNPLVHTFDGRDATFFAYLRETPPDRRIIVEVGPYNDQLEDDTSNDQLLKILHTRLTSQNTKETASLDRFAFPTGSSRAPDSVVAPYLGYDPYCDGTIVSSLRGLFESGQAVFEGDGLSYLAPGSSACFYLLYQLEPDACPCQVYEASFGPALLDASFGTYDATVEGEDVSGYRVTRPPELALESEDKQAVAPLEQVPVTVHLETRTVGCGGDWSALFQVCGTPQGAVGQGLLDPDDPENTPQEEVVALFDPLDDTATVEFRTGDLPGDYALCVYPQPMDGGCAGAEPLTLTVIATGIGLLPEHDGDESETVGTFIREVEAENPLEAEVLLASDASTQVESVRFDLDGDQVTDNAKPYTATFDMANLGDDSLLTLRARFDDGSAFEETYPFYAVPLPEWSRSLENLSAHVARTFNPTLDRYEFLADEFPADFAWGNQVPLDMPVVGGTDLDLTLGYTIDAKFYLTEEAEFFGTGEMSGEMDDVAFDADGEVFAEFDREFKLLPGAYGQTDAEIEIALNQSKYKLAEIPVLEVPVDIITVLGAKADIDSYGLALFDENFNVEESTFSPRVEGKFYARTTFSGGLGMIDLEIRARACSEIDTVLAYQTGAAEVMETHFGGIVAFWVMVEGSLFWNHETYAGELAHGMFGPYPFGDGPLHDTGEVSSLAECADEAFDHRDRFFARSDIVASRDGRVLLVRTKDVSGTTDAPESDALSREASASPDPEIVVAFGDNTGFGDEVQITDNPYWETDPTGVLLPDGRALALWTSNAGSESLTQLNDILSQQEIGFSYYNGESWGEEDLLTSDDLPDGQVRVAYDETLDRALAVWLHNDNPNFDALDRSGWSLRYALFDPETEAWTQPASVPTVDADALVLHPALAADGLGHFVAVWIQDEDGQLFTDLEAVQGGTRVAAWSPDTDVMFSIFDGEDWSPAQTISDDNAFVEQFPALTRTPDGDVAVAWVAREVARDRLEMSLMHLEDGTAEPPTLVEVGAYFIESPSLAVDESGELTLAYRMHDGVDDELYAKRGEIESFLLGQSPPDGLPADTIPSRARLTYEAGGAWSPRVAVLPEGEVFVTWAETDGTAADRGGLAGKLSPGIQLAELRPSPRARLDGTFDVRPLRDDDEEIEALELDVGVAVTTAGAFSLRANLIGRHGQVIATSASETTELDPGQHELSLSFDGRTIAGTGQGGPFKVRGISLLDHTLSPVVIDAHPDDIETEAFEPGEFRRPRLDIDRDLFWGVTDQVHLTVIDEGLEQAPSITIDGPTLSEPQLLTLETTGPGVFEGTVGFTENADEVGEGVLLVTPASVFWASYVDSEGKTWTQAFGWSPPKPEPKTLDVSVWPRRSGSVTGEGISCPSDCYRTVFVGDRVTLEATPAEGYVFTGWEGGACSGSGTCDFLLRDDVEVRAGFEPADEGATPTVTPAPTQEPVDTSATPSMSSETPPPSPTAEPGENDDTGCSCKTTSPWRGEWSPLALAFLLVFRRSTRKTRKQCH